MEKMASMGLSSLPVDSIAVPDQSPLYRHNQVQLNDSLNIAHRLTRYFPGHFVAALYELQYIFNKNGIKAYVIGGIVRDLLLSEDRRLELSDLDITVEGDALQATNLILGDSKNFFVEERFPEFGTTVIHYKESLYIDVASTRKETYTNCGALPQVFERGVPLEDDVIRRDFTVNALALSIHELGKVLDYTGGIADIDAQEIRVLHPVSFFEDPSRIFRALKFCARLDFKLSLGTKRLLEKFLIYGQSVYKGGVERIKEELSEFLTAKESTAKHHWIEYFQSVQGLKLINMGLPHACLALPPHKTRHEYWTDISEMLIQVQTALGKESEESVDSPIDSEADSCQWEVYLCLLLEHLGKDERAQTELRLGLTKAERDAVEHYQTLLSKNSLATLNFTSSVDVYKVFHPMPLASLIAGILTLGYHAPELFKKALEALVNYQERWSQIKVELDGNDLIDLGIPEGIQVGLTLRQLLYARVGGQLTSRMDEVHFVQKLLQEASPPEETPGANVPH